VGNLKEKSKLVKIIDNIKSTLEPEELKDVNRLYDKYISIQNADVERLKAYKNFLQGYLSAKYKK
jgi:hypothetical protein